MIERILTFGAFIKIGKLRLLPQIFSEFSVDPKKFTFFTQTKSSKKKVFSQKFQKIFI